METSMCPKCLREAYMTVNLTNYTIICHQCRKEMTVDFLAEWTKLFETANKIEEENVDRYPLS